MPVQTVIKLRRDTTANWESTDPVLAAGEFGIDSTLNKIKIGNGDDAWSELDYSFDEFLQSQIIGLPEFEVSTEA